MNELLYEDSSEIDWDDLLDTDNPAFLLDYLREPFPTYDLWLNEWRFSRLSGEEILKLITGMSEENGLDVAACRLGIRYELIEQGKSGDVLDRLIEEGFRYAVRDYVSFMTLRFHRVEEVLRPRKGETDDGKIREIAEGLEKLFSLLGTDAALIESHVPEKRAVGTVGRMLFRFQALLK